MSTAECDDNYGCTWQGYFAYKDGQHPLSWVQSNNIVSMYSTDGSHTGYKNKTIRIQVNGKTIEVQVLDTCGDSDCGGCCTKNAAPSGNLIDIEYYTYLNNFGKSPEGNAHGQICFQDA